MMPAMPFNTLFQPASCVAPSEVTQVVSPRAKKW